MNYTALALSTARINILRCQARTFCSKVQEDPVQHLREVVEQNKQKGCNLKENEAKTEEPTIPRNLLDGIHTTSKQKEMGVHYSKKPFKVRLEAGKMYNWCTCGWSRNQPFCDQAHNNIFLKTKLKPVWFVVEETKDYWLCQCKQTSNRPFCDGTHKRPDIQEKKH